MSNAIIGKSKTGYVSGTRAIWSQASHSENQKTDNSFSEVLNFLFSASQQTKPTSLENSRNATPSPKSVKVQIEGVPVTGIIDTGSDITIIGGELFKVIINSAQLKTKHLDQLTGELVRIIISPSYWMVRWM